MIRIQSNEPKSTAHDRIDRADQNRRARSHDHINAEIIARLDIAEEYRELGIHFVGQPRSSGSYECIPPGEDRNQSKPSAFVNIKSGRYIDSGKSGDNLSLWDFAVTYGGGRFADWKEARKHYAEKAGVSLARTGRPPERPKDQLEFEDWTQGNETLANIWCALHKKGITLESIKSNGGRIAHYPCFKDKETQQRRRGQYKCIALPCYGDQLLNADPVAWVIWEINGRMLPVFRGKTVPPDFVKMKSVGPTRGAMMGLHGLAQLAKANANVRMIWKTGGPSDMLALFAAIPPEYRDLDLVLTNASGENGDVLPHQAAIFAGHNVRIVHDADTAGEVGAMKWLAELENTQTKLHRRLPYTIEKKDGKDLRDFFITNNGSSYRALCEIFCGPELPPDYAEGADPETCDDGRIRIQSNDPDLPKITHKAIEALRSYNNPARIFRFAGIPVRVENDDCGRPMTRKLDRVHMKHELARAADWVKETSDGETPSSPPNDVVDDVLATPEIPLPVLERFINAPCFSADGMLHREPGYCRIGRTYYAPAEKFIVPDVPDRPAAGDIEKARQLLEEPLYDFPFCSESDKSHAIALMILPFARSLIKGATPLHLIEKPRPGTGAGLLVQILAWPAIGTEIGTTPEGGDEDEWRKRITAILKDSPAYVFIDNLHRRLDSSTVALAITSPLYSDRLLGTSDNVKLPVRCCWVASANNPVLSNEIARRTIRIRIDAKVDKPWLRVQFRHSDLLQWVKDNRPQLTWAVLTIIQAWLAAGRPLDKSTKIGSFEDWSYIIGGILKCAGIPGFLDNLKEFYEEVDSESAVWEVFISTWWEQFRDDEVSVKQLLDIAVNSEISVGDGSEQSKKIRLGKSLARMRDRHFKIPDNTTTEVVLERGKLHKRAYAWRLISNGSQNSPHEPATEDGEA
jgi:hypothetical protein